MATAVAIPYYIVHRREQTGRIMEDPVKSAVTAMIVGLAFPVTVPFSIIFGGAEALHQYLKR